MFIQSCACMVLVSLLLPAAGAAQNLVPNGDFDSDLSGWEQQPEGSASWDVLDIDGAPASGSARLTTMEAAGGARVYPLRQCVTLSSTDPIFLSASGMLDATAGGRLVFSYSARATADCSGGSFATGGAFLDSPGAWEDYTTRIVVLSFPASVELLLGIEKTAAGGTLGGNFDAVSIEADTTVFRNGFE